MKELIVATDGADLIIIGRAVIKDTIETDIRFQGTQINIDELIKYVPEKTLEDIGLKKASGMMNMDGSIQGFILDSILPEVKMEFEMKKGFLQIAGYPSLKNISIAGYLTNGIMRNNTTTTVNIRKFHAETDKSSVDMSGILNNLDRIQYKINSDMVIELGEFKEFIPDSMMQDATGQIRAKLSTKGVLPDSVGPDFIDYFLETSQLELNLNNLFLALDSNLSLDALSGKLTYDLNHITARYLHVGVPLYHINIKNASFDAQLSGKLSEPSNLEIDLKSYQFRTDSSAFYGSVKIQNLEAPEFKLTSNFKLNLSETKVYLPDTLVKDVSGEITALIVSRGKLNLDSISDQINDLIFENSEFRIKFDNVSVNMPDTLLSVNNLSGRL
jgi:hypothetical protein